MTETDDLVARHYGSHGSLEQAINAGLIAMGFSPDDLRPEHLAAVDEFHMGGHEATVRLAERMALAPGMSVLDIGSGLGGPARFFARQYGCAVVGIDLTPEYVAVAESLTRRVGLAGSVHFRCGSATELPFAQASFDAATLLHVAMNVSDKERLCAEAARVLKTGGVFAIYDVMRTGDGELPFPVPWAGTPHVSFLADVASYRRAAEAAGFEVIAEENRGEPALEFFRRMKSRFAESGPPPLGLHILMGSAAGQKVDNMIKSLEQRVIAPVEMLCRRT